MTTAPANLAANATRSAPPMCLCVALLGLTTIGAYGVAYYSIGVLLPAIAADTGWPSGLLASGFSLGLLL